MNLVNYLFGSKTEKETTTKETTTKETETNKKIYLLYGAKVRISNEYSYVVAVFDNQELAIKELNVINEKYNIKNLGRTIFDPETGINEYHYKYFLVDCEINKNYNKSIENFTYGQHEKLVFINRNF